MNIQIFGKSKCFDTKKAERYFKERRIKFQSIDLVKFGMAGKEFDSVLRAVGGIDNLIDWDSKGFDGSKGGTVTLTGTLRNGPHTQLNVEGKTVSINIQLKDKLENQRAKVSSLKGQLAAAKKEIAALKGEE